MIVVDVHHDTGPVNVPAILSPRAPPGRIVLPIVRRSVHAVLPPQDILYRFPVVDIDVIIVVRIITAAAIGVAFYRLHDDFFTVEVFIADDLEHRVSPAKDLDLDHGHILDITAVYQCLEDDGVKVSLPAVFYPDVVDPAVVVQVEVIDGISFRVELPFEISERRGLFEQIQCSFEAEVITFIPGALRAVLRMY
jgi:hypothetical protein